MELNTLNCRQYNSLIKYYSCNLTKVTTNRYFLQANLELNRDLDKGAEIQMIIFVKFTKENKVLKFLDLKVKVCDLYDSKMSSLVIKEVIREMKRVSNFPHSCPVKGNYAYWLTNFTVTENFFPTYTPTIDFNYTLRFYEKKRLLGDMVIEGSTLRRS
uniref:Arrestin-like N-terminal domain-containing protein n=1 Tax=Musca domestica TaxID=7370 RepID=A0A1I8N3Z0_MUSDO